MPYGVPCSHMCRQSAEFLILINANANRVKDQNYDNEHKVLGPKDIGRTADRYGYSIITFIIDMGFTTRHLTRLFYIKKLDLCDIITHQILSIQVYSKITNQK